MTEQQHPITPPPLELVDTWEEEANQSDKPRLDYIATEEEANQSGKPRLDYIATQAARWGADQELEACCKALEDIWDNDDVVTQGDFLQALRTARRPKPPSLAEQALEALEAEDDAWPVRSLEKGRRFDTIRAALERLQELESKQ